MSGEDGAKTGGATRMPGRERRGSIESAARRVFLEYGLAGARTKQIAEEAGIAEAVIYRHFESKEELFEAAILTRLEQSVAELAELCDRSAGLEMSTFVEENVLLHEQFLKAMIEIAPLLGTALFSDQTNGGTFYNERLLPLLRRIDRAIESAFGTFPHAEVQPGLVTSAMLGTYYWLALRAGFEGEPLKTRDIARQVNAIFARGLAGPARSTG